MSDVQPGPGQAPKGVSSADFARVVALSDALFAFSLTLLAVNIMPTAADVPALTANLAASLWDMRRLFAVYGLTFVIVYAKWNGHRRLFDAVDRYDHRFLQLNMVMLFFIAAMPLPAYVIGTQGGQVAAVFFFAGYQMATTVIVLAMWHYAAGRRALVRADLPAGWIRLNLTQQWLMVAVFGVSLPLALFSVQLAEYSWLLLLAIRPVSDWLYERHGTPSSPAT